MPTIRPTVDLAAGGVEGNAVAGNQFEFIQVPSRVQIWGVHEGTGVGELEVFFGQELQLPQAQANKVTAGGPNINQDLLVDDYAAPGDRLVLRCTETGGVDAVQMRLLVKITPMAV